MDHALFQNNYTANRHQMLLEKTTVSKWSIKNGATVESAITHFHDGWLVGLYYPELKRNTEPDKIQ